MEVLGEDVLFLSTPSSQRATNDVQASDSSNVFLSTPSSQRATPVIFVFAFPPIISIHALFAEGDTLPSHLIPTAWNFYPRPLRRGRHRALHPQ